jgi:hypothetical protein
MLTGIAVDLWGPPMCGHHAKVGATDSVLLQGRLPRSTLLPLHTSSWARRTQTVELEVLVEVGCDINHWHAAKDGRTPAINLAASNGPGGRARAARKEGCTVKPVTRLWMAGASLAKKRMMAVGSLRLVLRSRAVDEVFRFRFESRSLLPEVAPEREPPH